MLEIWPTNAGRYWIVGTSANPAGKFEDDGSFSVLHELVLDKTIEWPDGLSLWSTRPVDDPAYAVRRDGTGFLNWRNEQLWPSPHFPFTPLSRFSEEPVTAPQPAYARRILAEEEWNGFIACGGREPVDLLPIFDPEFKTKEISLYVNDERAYGQSGYGQPKYVLDRTGYLYVSGVWGRNG